MKSWNWNRRTVETPEPPRSASADAVPWSFGPEDAAITAGLLAATLLLCVPTALHLRGETRRVDAERAQIHEECRAVLSTMHFLESRRVALTHLRRAADRYVADVEARPMVPWTTAVGELSRRRPGGVWATRLAGDGPRFRAWVRASRPELVNDYARRLRESPYVEFATLPEAGATEAQVMGRLVGD